MKKLMKWALFFLPLCVLSVLPLNAQEVISLEGSWDFAIGDTARYHDYVMLPGSMLTNGKGDPVTADTRWTGSLYDSSYYYNPFMEQYRQEGNVGSGQISSQCLCAGYMGAKAHYAVSGATAY